jgi:hypothetical protein
MTRITSILFIYLAKCVVTIYRNSGPDARKKWNDRTQQVAFNSLHLIIQALRRELGQLAQSQT